MYYYYYHYDTTDFNSLFVCLFVIGDFIFIKIHIDY